MMCLTLPGRLQTRAITLIGVFLLTLGFVAGTQNLAYFLMFFRMAGVAVLLDIFVYSRLIRFQPRWLTILLGGLEFLILFAISPRPVNLPQMVGFYLPAWLIAWLTLEILIPFFWARWLEDGGEFRRL